MISNLSLIARGSHMYFARRMKHYEIGMSEQMILMHLAAVDKENQDGIAQYFRLDKGAVAKITAKLALKGMITRDRNKDNLRENVIAITDKGRSLINELETVAKEWEKQVMKGFTEEQKQELREMLTKAATNVSTYLGKL